MDRRSPEFGRTCKSTARSNHHAAVPFAPSAKMKRTPCLIVIRISEQGLGGQPVASDGMKAGAQGTWVYSLKGDWKNKYYTFQVNSGGKWLNETTDIYAKATGANGLRGMVVNLKETNPPGWDNDRRPPMQSFNDIIIWEVHPRDLSMNSSSGIKAKGKYLGFTEKGTRNPAGDKTGLDHILDLGVTHVHFLPAFDFRSIDETRLEANRYNWGYDPQRVENSRQRRRDQRKGIERERLRQNPNGKSDHSGEVHARSSWQHQRLGSATR